MADFLECARCRTRYPLEPLFRGCPACRARGVVAPLLARYLRNRLRFAWDQGDAPSARMWVYESALPTSPAASKVSLGEGGTELRAVTLPGVGDPVHLKLEPQNPTGSFKDRLNSVAVTMALGHGAPGMVCSSTGNHGVSLAAYAKAAGLKCVVVLPQEAPAAAVEEITAHAGLPIVTAWDDRGPWIEWLVEGRGWTPSGRNFPRAYGNPYGLEGYKTIAYEVVRQLGRAPATVFVPLGGGDGIYGVWKGFGELRDAGIIDSLPRMIGCQPELSASVHRAFAAAAEHVAAVALQISVALSLTDRQGGDHALWAVRESNGDVLALSERDILDAGDELAGLGIDAEAAGAAALAGLRRFAAVARPPIVCVITGHGARWRGPDARNAARVGPRRPEELEEWLGR